ncbi:MAG TPA: hypothetical protein VNO43_01310, partial [Candidatus Eisenbacteria bacterium]|nr:hypothetical protein [Candidatus Eisenbacteria bacterium]
MAALLGAFRHRAREIARHRRVRRWVSALVCLIAAIGFLGGLAAPPLARHFLAARLSQALHRDVSIERVRINPYTLSTTIDGFTMKERDGSATALSFDEFYLNLQLQSLFRRGLVIKEMRLVRPYIRLVRGDDYRYNYHDLHDEFTGGPPSG